MTLPRSFEHQNSDKSVFDQDRVALATLEAASSQQTRDARRDARCFLLRVFSTEKECAGVFFSLVVATYFDKQRDRSLASCLGITNPGKL